MKRPWSVAVPVVLGFCEISHIMIDGSPGWQGTVRGCFNSCI
jgi:hypothetical protein